MALGRTDELPEPTGRLVGRAAAGLRRRLDAQCHRVDGAHEAVHRDPVNHHPLQKVDHLVRRAAQTDAANRATSGRAMPCVLCPSGAAYVARLLVHGAVFGQCRLLQRPLDARQAPPTLTTPGMSGTDWAISVHGRGRGANLDVVEERRQGVRRQGTERRLQLAEVVGRLASVLARQNGRSPLPGTPLGQAPITAARLHARRARRAPSRWHRTRRLACSGTP